MGLGQWWLGETWGCLCTCAFCLSISWDLAVVGRGGPWWEVVRQDGFLVLKSLAFRVQCKRERWSDEKWVVRTLDCGHRGSVLLVTCFVVVIRKPLRNNTMIVLESPWFVFSCLGFGRGGPWWAVVSCYVRPCLLDVTMFNCTVLHLVTWWLLSDPVLKIRRKALWRIVSMWVG